MLQKQFRLNSILEMTYIVNPFTSFKVWKIDLQIDKKSWIVIHGGQSRHTNINHQTMKKSFTQDGKSLMRAKIAPRSFPLDDSFAILRRTLFDSVKYSRVSPNSIGVTIHAIDQFI